ncbi:MAG: alpha/beta fold hydrolase [Burkholderiales bacterium]|nr:alpha/beta fold hydrolase [Burkholderiales bacterium]
MSEPIRFASDGLQLAGLLHRPADQKPHERRPAFIVMHGFGGSNQGASGVWAARALTGWGYVCLQFTFRGCGESEGERGRVICLEQVADARHAITYLQSRPEVDPERIALCGLSLGAAVAIYTAGMDDRAAAVISQGGWGNGERKFRLQHTGPEWSRFMAQLTDGIRMRETTGRSLMVPRYDIVPIPPRLRDYLANDPGSIMEFPAETPLSMFLFQPEEMIARISPRPVLLLHGAGDSVTPASESMALFKRARPPVELHLIDGADHFMFAEDNERTVTLVRQWIERYFPMPRHLIQIK